MGERASEAVHYHCFEEWRIGNRVCTLASSICDRVILHSNGKANWSKTRGPSVDEYKVPGMMTMFASCRKKKKKSSWVDLCTFPRVKPPLVPVGRLFFLEYIFLRSQSGFSSLAEVRSFFSPSPSAKAMAGGSPTAFLLWSVLSCLVGVSLSRSQIKQPDHHSSIASSSFTSGTTIDSSVCDGARPAGAQAHSSVS